jgi:hypothetical protein
MARYLSTMVLAKMPGWVVDDATSVREEVAHLRGLSHAELWRLAELCAQDALWALAAGDHAQQALSYRDPLPASSVAALERLRRESGWGRRGP